MNRMSDERSAMRDDIVPTPVGVNLSGVVPDINSYLPLSPRPWG